MIEPDEARKRELIEHVLNLHRSGKSRDSIRQWFRHLTESEQAFVYTWQRAHVKALTEFAERVGRIAEQAERDIEEAHEKLLQEVWREQTNGARR